MQDQQKITRLLEALDLAVVYIEAITGGDCDESATYLHLLKELRECGEEVEA